MENYTRNFSQISYPNEFQFSFEKDYSFLEATTWMKEYWSLSFVLVIVYVLLIHAGRAYMKNRPRYTLQGPLVVWNASLSFLYIFGLIRAYPGYSSFITSNGYYELTCADCPFGCHKVTLFWGWIFVLLKAPELLDTAFVVLRKQPLFFLHWYHHCTVLVFTWYMYSNVSSSGGLYGIVNAFVHALMYFYYTLKSLKIHVPRPISMALTFIQISQMAVGCYTNYFVLQTIKRGGFCPVSYFDVWAGFTIYISYFILFLWYFYRAYVAKDPFVIAKMKGKKID